MSSAPLTSARLVELLTAAVAVLERKACTVSGSGGSSTAAHAASQRALSDLLSALQHGFGFSPSIALAGAALVPLPSPSADVEAALDSLARLIAAGSVPRARGDAREVADEALQVVYALASGSPLRVAVLAGHGALVRSLAGALSTVSDSAHIKTQAMCASAALMFVSLHPAVANLWRAGESGAALRALAVALARAFGALARHVDSALLVEAAISTALPVAIQACPEPERPGFCEAMLKQEGFVGALCACVARGAAVLPPPGAALSCEDDPPGAGALKVLTALCGGAWPEFEFDGGRLVCAIVTAPLEQPRPRPAEAAVIESLLSAAPALPGRVVDVVVAGAPWYSAVIAALGSAGAGAGSGSSSSGGTGGADQTRLVSGFICLANHLLARSLSALELMPTRALAAAGAARGGLIARLTPALLGLTEAAQAVACVPSGPGLAAVIAWRSWRPPPCAWSKRPRASWKARRLLSWATRRARSPLSCA